MLRNFTQLDVTDLEARLAIVIVIATLISVPLIDGDPLATWMLVPFAACAFAATAIIIALRNKERPPVDWGD
ncbi:MAG: hypothetical protein Q4A92_09825 [Corynebacterium sp.]|nr:hypothetical protein [Corynebacterium sp.]